jgi:phage tail-like protein
MTGTPCLTTGRPSSVDALAYARSETISGGAMANGDPYASYRFLVVIDGNTAGFSTVSGLEVQIEAIEYRNGGDPVTRKIPGLPRYQNLVFQRGYTASTELWDWVSSAIDGPVERKALVVSVLDESGNEALKFAVAQAWPCRYRGPELNALENGVAIEELEICHEGFELV